MQNNKSENWWEKENHHLVLNKLSGQDRAKYKQLVFGYFYGQKGNLKDISDLYIKAGIDAERHLMFGKPPIDEILLLC